jgi:hypothetical protein
VKRREPRLRLLRFRTLDGRAREALLSMLKSLPPPPAGCEGTPGSSADFVLDEIARTVAQVGTPGSPSAHVAARLTPDGQLGIVLVGGFGSEATAQPLPPSERQLARVRRVGAASFEIAFDPGPDSRTLNEAPDA